VVSILLFLTLLFLVPVLMLDLDLPEELAQGPTGWLGEARDLPWMHVFPHWVEELWVPGHVLFGQELCYAMVGSGTGPRALLD